MSQILGEINFFDSPEASFGLLVHLPDGVVLDGQDHEAMWVVFQQGFFDLKHFQVFCDVFDLRLLCHVVF